MNDSVYIVAGGVSLENFDFSKLRNKDVIAINHSIIDCPFAKYFITMDYTFIDYIKEKTNGKLSREKFKNTLAHKYFVVALNNDFIVKIKNFYVDIRNNYRYDLKEFDTIIESHSDTEFGSNFSSFSHGCNSGSCAIQLAYLLNYTNIYLLGFDLYSTLKTHYHSDYNVNAIDFQQRLNFYYSYVINNLLMAFELFPDKNIYSCSEHSLLNEYLSYKSLNSIK